MSPSTEKGRSSVPSLSFNNILLGNRKGLGKEPPCQTTTTHRGSQTSSLNSTSISSARVRVTSRPSIASTPASSANPVSSPSPPRISATLASTVSRPRRTFSPRWRATRSRSMVIISTTSPMSWASRSRLRPSAPTSPAARPSTGSRTGCSSRLPKSPTSRRPSTTSLMRSRRRSSAGGTQGEA